MRILLFTLLIGLINIKSFSQNIDNERGMFFVDNFPTTVTNAQPQTWDVLQDKRGIMYFANQNGCVVEYDGVNWRHIPVKNATSVRSLALGKDGRVYVGAVGDFGYLIPNKNGKLNYRSLISQLDSADRNFNDIWQIESFGNDIFFRTKYKLFCYTPSLDSLDYGKFKYWKSKSGFHLLFKTGNKLIIRERKVGFKEYKDGKWSIIKDGYKFSNTKAYSMNAVNDKLLISTKTQGLFSSDLNLENGIKKDIGYHDLFLTKAWVYNGINITNKKLAYGSINNGVLLVNEKGKILSGVNRQSGMQDEAVLSLAYKKNQPMWLTLDNGISRVDIEAPFRFWDYSKGLKGIITDVCRFNNKIYIVTTLGAYCLENPNFHTNPTDLSEMSLMKNMKRQSWDLEIFPKDNTLLIATSSGIFEIKNNVAKQINKSKRIFQLHASKKHPNRVYAGTKTGLFYIEKKHGKWTDAKKINKISDEIRSLYESETGDVWLGTHHTGIIYYNSEKDTLVHYKEIEGQKIESNDIFIVNNKLRAVLGGVIYKLDSTKNLVRDKFFEKYINYKEQNIFNVAAVNNKFFLSVSNKKNNAGSIISIIKNSDSTAKKDTLSFMRLPKSIALSIVTEANGYVWFATGSGLYRYDSNIKKDNSQNFNVYLREVLAGDSVLFAGSHVNVINNKTIVVKKQNKAVIPDINSNHNTISFKFAANFYEQEDETKYSCFLKDFDDDWSKWTKNSQKEYTNLPSGVYTFKVRAKNIYGIISKEGTHVFRINPPWYKTIWAVLIYLILGVAALKGIILANTWRLMKDKQKLEKIINERTYEIQQKNKELELQKIELEKLSLVARKTDNAILITDEKGNFEWVNEGYTRMFGYNLDELISNVSNNIIGRHTNEDTVKKIQYCIDNKKTVSYQLIVKSKLKEKVWVQTTLTPILDENNNILKLIAIDSNITKIKKAEEEIREQKQQLEIQNENIKSSIRYALNIQQAILPLSENMNRILKEYFILYKPKDIVSGDFYWFSYVEPTNYNEEMLFLSVIDCTGHGVPGAFMSMIGNRLLNEIVNERQIFEPNIILEELNKGIRKALKQEQTDNNDGMDLCICRLEETTQGNRMVFSGAKRPMYYYSHEEKEVVKLKGDRKSIGGTCNSKNNTSFTNQTVELKENDIIYLTTDGLVDQNSVERKKYGSLRFIETLKNIGKEPLEQQKNLLEQELKQHMENTQQRDDITILAVKI